LTNTAQNHGHHLEDSNLILSYAFLLARYHIFHARHQFSNYRELYSKPTSLEDNLLALQHTVLTQGDFCISQV